MTTAPAPAAVETRPAPEDPRLTHLFCCDPTVSLCGLDLSRTPHGMKPGEAECAVCYDLLDEICLICGN